MNTYATMNSRLSSMDLYHQTVFLRADLNVPLKDGSIINDFKLQASLPTIDLLLQKNAIITLATHLGRPKNQEPKLSTKHLIPWFEKKGYKIDFAKNPIQATEKSKKKDSLKIILLENLRFFPGEQNHDEIFAQELAHCGSIYINDAFGALHRNDTSLTLLPKRYPPEAKTIGLLIEKELKALHSLIDKPKQPFVIILGGGKIKTKLPFLKSMVKKIDTILLCPVLVFTVMKALGKPVGKSLVDHNALEEIKMLFAQPQTKSIVQLPHDFQIALESIDGALAYTEDQNIPANAFGIAIGPKTLREFTHLIKEAHTVFFNGPMGFFDRPETLKATCNLLEVMAQSKAYTIIGGGDSIAAAFKCSVANKIDFLSTGGGATLAYLSGATLPGLEYMF